MQEPENSPSLRNDGVDRLPWQQKQPWHAQSHYRFEVSETKDGETAVLFATDSGSAKTRQDAAELHSLLLRTFHAPRYSVRVERWEFSGRAVNAREEFTAPRS